jgi:hypothetical protein
MHIRSSITHSTLVMVLAAAAACSSDDGPVGPTPPPPGPSVLLKDIVIPNLPSPFYHFEYDAGGRLTVASFASGLTQYDLAYDGGRLSEMRNNIIVNHDRLVYSYDDAGRVSEVRYLDAAGTAYTRLHFAYVGQKLIRLERDRSVNAGFIVDKTMSLSYDGDGNLFELVDHRSAIPGAQDEATFVDRYELYDTGTNVDGFSLIHNEFFDHLVLLPGVQLQKGNPGRETRTGDGINYRVDYTYTYDGNLPLTKRGEGTFLNGADAGRRFQTNSVFSYY